MEYEPESMWLLKFMKQSLRWANDPVYVDLGCSHPTNASLTHFCRDLGWRGVAIDANCDYTKEWENAGCGEHFYCALLSNQENARFCVHDNSFTSRISPSAETDYPERWGIRRTEIRPCVSLEGILSVKHIGGIDLLVCDLEGFDEKVLRTLDWAYHNPSFVIVEHTAAAEPLNHELLNFVLEQGYELLRMFTANAIFKRK